MADALGDRCKAFEMAEAGRKAMLGLPLLARLDGRAFHSFTRGLKRPHDPDFVTCMLETTKALVEEFRPRVGYTQSDEITLAWLEPSGGRSQYPFDGRFQKMTSVLAGYASAVFARLVLRYLPAKADAVPCFDCRVWQVPTIDDALDVFRWREDDAVKNSVSMLAQAHFSHRQLHEKHTRDKLIMLEERGVVWGNEPTHVKRGVYLKRRTVERELTPDELARIPEKSRPPPGFTFTRSVVDMLNIEPLRRVPDAASVLGLDAKMPPATREGAGGEGSVGNV